MTLPVSFTQMQTCIMEQKMERRFYNFLFRVVNIEAEHCRSLQEEAIRCKGVMCSFENFEDRVEVVEIMNSWQLFLIWKFVSKSWDFSHSSVSVS